MLCATACHVWGSELRKVVRRWCVLYILTPRCASRHSGVKFSISHLATWLRARRFSEPTFPPSWPTKHWKNIAIRVFPNILCHCIIFLLTSARLCIFFLLTLLLCSACFSSDSTSLVCFSSLHTVGSLTSKLPSIKI